MENFDCRALPLRVLDEVYSISRYRPLVFSQLSLHQHDLKCLCQSLTQYPRLAPNQLLLVQVVFP